MMKKNMPSSGPLYLVQKCNDLKRIWKDLSKRTQKSFRMTLSDSSQVDEGSLSRFCVEVESDGLAE